jgi:hypothetical protein
LPASQGRAAAGGGHDSPVSRSYGPRAGSRWSASPVEELQADLDEFMRHYRDPGHHGYRTQGRTPLQTFHDHLARPEVAPVAA